MYVKKYYCEHCGKELDDMKDYIDISIDIVYDLTTTDLCQDCIKKLWGVIGKFCSVQKEKKNE